MHNKAICDVSTFILQYVQTTKSSTVTITRKIYVQVKSCLNIYKTAAYAMYMYVFIQARCHMSSSTTATGLTM